MSIMDIFGFSPMSGLFLSLAISISSCKQEPVEYVDYFASSTPLAGTPATLIHDWNGIGVRIIEQTPGFKSPVAARALAYIHLAVYESMVPGMKHEKSFSGLLNSFNYSINLENAQYNWEASANSSYFHMLKLMIPSISDLHKNEVNQFYNNKRKLLQEKVSDQTITRSEKFGEKIAQIVFSFCQGWWAIRI